MSEEDHEHQLGNEAEAKADYEVSKAKHEWTDKDTCDIRYKYLENRIIELERMVEVIDRRTDT